VATVLASALASALATVYSNYIVPFLFTKNENVKSILVKAMECSLDVPIPGIENKSIGLSIDISGSMNGEPLLQAGLLAIPFLKCNKLWFTLFDDNLYEECDHIEGGYNYGYKCPKITGVPYKEAIEKLLKLQTAGGTDVSIPIITAIKNKIKMDLMILLTDEQQNSGSPVVKAWKEYRNKVNPEAKLWVINASNYTFSLDSKETDSSITTYQSVTSEIFRNIQYLDGGLVSLIENC
jgi:60 kDa SS-A/Ro ribonucleoprotein